MKLKIDLSVKLLIPNLHQHIYPCLLIAQEASFINHISVNTLYIPDYITATIEKKEAIANINDISNYHIWLVSP